MVFALDLIDQVDRQVSMPFNAEPLVTATSQIFKFAVT
jgi:hypothetical protein